MHFLASVAAIPWTREPSASWPARESDEIDAVHSVLLSRIRHLGVSCLYGRSNDVEGIFTLDDEGVGEVDVTTRAENTDTAKEKRDGHRKRPDFFGVKPFPMITFRSRKLVSRGDNRLRAAGTRTLRGVSKEITVDMERFGSANAMGACRTAFAGSFTIRSAYGMSWRPEALGDEAKLIVAIEGTRH